MDLLHFYLECLAHMFTDFPLAFDLAGIWEYTWRSVVAISIPAAVLAGVAALAGRLSS